jgi:hypothetical protein
MREVNFSIPNVNKASVGITTALYDRRALDCTSTLPLINSLNHLAYLTTSSARIRDILTVDGGVERLVCLLKAGRSKDMMDMWKWNLAFQCVVNIGVRGSEPVRTRVVEADMVPVIATILDNYIKVVDRCREKAEEAKAKNQRDHPQVINGSRYTRGSKGASFTNRSSRVDAEHRTFRRQAPPPAIEVPTSFASTSPPPIDTGAMEITPTVSQFAHTSPPEQTTFSIHRHHHHHHRHRAQDSQQGFVPPSRHPIQPLATAVPSMDATDGFNIRPVRDVDRLPSMLPGFHSGLTSQPESPTTPLPPAQMRSPSVRPTSMSAPAARSRRRPSIRHQASSAAEPDDNGDSMVSDESGEPDIAGGNTADIQSAVNIQDISMDEGDSMLTAVETPLGLTTPTVSETQDAGTFNITHRSAIDGSLINDATTPTGPTMTMGLSPAQTTMTNNSPAIMNATIPRYLLDRPTPANAQVLAAMPRDEDVLMSLQLLAYVSKYCNLRSYFQKSHLVPKLKIGNELHLLDQENPESFPSPLEEEYEEDYLLPDDFNIFPLVEKFTVRHHSQDMQYWAGVVMRNLCRKDDSRGGIRQCAYYQCGKWEEFTRQFAKCRRCRRTKYCSKECQKSAWVYHRHWCVAAT